MVLSSFLRHLCGAWGPLRRARGSGNRDLNKMRWTAQLSFEPGSYDEETGFAKWTECNELERVDGPCWVTDDTARAGMTPSAYYRKRLASEKGVSVEEVSEEDVRRFDTVANRIRWHFKAGAPPDRSERDRICVHMRSHSSSFCPPCTTVAPAAHRR